MVIIACLDLEFAELKEEDMPMFSCLYLNTSFN